MEPEQTPEEVLSEKQPSIWNTVTPLSKYLTMVLFIALPFIGGWIGYMFAPEKVVEIERVVEVEKTVEVEIETEKITSTLKESEPGTSTYVNDEFGFSFDYPSEYGELDTDLYPGPSPDNKSLLRIRSEDDQTLIAILYGTNYNSGTDTNKNPICTNGVQSELSENCEEFANAAGTTYYRLDILYEYTAGWQRRYEIAVNEDFSLMMFVSGGDDGNFDELKESNQVILDSFTIVN